jgi:hypothetical protein
MPNILDPSFNIPDIRPTETGVESTAQAARRVGVFGSQIAAAQEQTGRDVGRGVGAAVDAAYGVAEHMEISKGAAHGAELVATLNESWNQTAKNADPNDPAVAAKWRAEVLEPALEQYRSGFLTKGGEQWAEHLVDTYRQHAVVKTSADMSSLAADAVHVNAVKTINGLSTAAFNDPSTVSFARDTLAHSLDGLTGSSPTISATDAAKVKGELTLKGEEQIVKSAIMGAIVKGGDWQSIANDPKNAPYVNAPEIQQFMRAERMYKRMDESEARNARVMTDYTNRQNWNTAADKLELSTIPQKVGDPPTLPDDYWSKVKEIGAMPGTDPGRLRSLIDNGERITTRLGKPEPLGPVSHATTMDLLASIRSGAMKSTDDIYKAYGDNKLNNADFNFLTREYAERKTPEGERLDKDRELFFKRFSFQFDPGGGQEVKTAGNLYVAEMAARQKEQAVRAAGGDPHSVYDPTSPNFFGKPDNLQKYKQPLQSLLQQQNQPGPQNAPATTVTSKAQYDALPSGANFVDEKGRRFVKP